MFEFMKLTSQFLYISSVLVVVKYTEALGPAGRGTVAIIALSLASCN